MKDRAKDDKNMLAHDNPTKHNQHYGLISLAEYLDINRNGGDWGYDVIAYHITESDSVDSILINGLTSHSNTKGMSTDRPSAVYLFGAESVVVNNIAVLGIVNPVILKVIIPSDYTQHLYSDHIYNMSIDDAQMSAMQYRDNVPPEWVTL